MIWIKMIIRKVEVKVKSKSKYENQTCKLGSHKKTKRESDDRRPPH